MSEKNMATAVYQSNDFENRRFVGKRETVAYVLNDAAASLNINDFKERYIYDVV